MKVMGQKSWAKGEPMTMIELPDPTPRDDEVRVRVKTIGVNPVDWKMRSQGPLRLAARAIGPKAPVVVGVDFMGVVDAVGARVTDVNIGDRVAGGTMFSRGQRGSYADTVIVRGDQIVSVPDHVSDDVAGALAVVGATATISLTTLGRLPHEGRVLVLGASGGVGQLVVRLARHLKQAHVVGVASKKNEALLKEIGCADVIDYGAGDPLVAATAFGPFDVVVDCAGGYSGAACRRLLKPGGRHVMVAAEGPSALLQPLMPPWTSKAVLGMPLKQNLQPVMDALAAGALSIPIVERVPLHEAERAHALSQTMRMTGKIILYT